MLWENRISLFVHKCIFPRFGLVMMNWKKWMLYLCCVWHDEAIDMHIVDFWAYLFMLILHDDDECCWLFKPTLSRISMINACLVVAWCCLMFIMPCHCVFLLEICLMLMNHEVEWMNVAAVFLNPKCMKTQKLWTGLAVYYSIENGPITTFPAFALNCVVLLNEEVNYHIATLTPMFDQYSILFAHVASN